MELGTQLSLTSGMDLLALVCVLTSRGQGDAVVCVLTSRDETTIYHIAFWLLEKSTTLGAPNKCFSLFGLIHYSAFSAAKAM